MIVLLQWRNGRNLKFQKAVPPLGKLFNKANLQVRTTTTTTTNNGSSILLLDTLMGKRVALAKVAIDLKTKRPSSNDDNGGDANVEDALYRNSNRDVDVFGFVNMSKI